VQDETRFQLEQQVKEAELRFRAEVAQAALKIADELLRRSVNGGDEQRLVQSFVAELGRPPAGEELDGRPRWIRGPPLRQGPLRAGRRQGELRGPRAGAGEPGAPLRRVARAAPDPGEPGLQASARSARSSRAAAPGGADPVVRNFALLLVERSRIASCPSSPAPTRS
jgi:hypothetical protein